MNKNIYGFIGFVLVIGTVAGGGLLRLGDWSSAEMVGGNVATLLMFLGGIALVVKAFKK